MPTWTGVGSGGSCARCASTGVGGRAMSPSQRASASPRCPEPNGGRLDRVSLIPLGPDRVRPGRVDLHLMPGGTPGTSTVSSIAPTHRSSKRSCASSGDLGWEVVVEFGFNHYGDRGSVDVLAWHGDSDATYRRGQVDPHRPPGNVHITRDQGARRPHACSPGPRLGFTVSQSTPCDAGNHGEPRHGGAPPGDVRRGAAGPHARHSVVAPKTKRLTRGTLVLVIHAHRDCYERDSGSRRPPGQRRHARTHAAQRSAAISD